MSIIVEMTQTQIQSQNNEANVLPSFFSVPRLITGPPGCGKSHFIRQKAEEEGKKLLHCPCRRDRTLRDGRQILHTWAKRSENSVIWLEGADDLTQEAQAFLRRISETHSPYVSFILECRDGSKLQDPIRSRYSLWSLPRPSWEDIEKAFSLFWISQPKETIEQIRKVLPDDELSYRKIQSIINLIQNHTHEWERCVQVKYTEENTYEKSINDLQLNAINPNTLIKLYLNQSKEYKEIVNYSQFLFNNGNPWAFLGYLRS